MFRFRLISSGCSVVLLGSSPMAVSVVPPRAAFSAAASFWGSPTSCFLLDMGDVRHFLPFSIHACSAATVSRRHCVVCEPACFAGGGFVGIARSVKTCPNVPAGMGSPWLSYRSSTQCAKATAAPAQNALRSPFVRHFPAADSGNGSVRKVWSAIACSDRPVQRNGRRAPPDSRLSGRSGASSLAITLVSASKSS